MKPPVCRVVVTLVLATGAAGFVCIGCEDPAADVPQAVLDQQARQAEAQKNRPKVPTTQELLTGPRSTVPLGPLPFTLRVPPGWNIEVTGPASHLAGRGPSGSEVTIQLASRPSIKRAEFDALVKSGKREQAEKPRSVLKAEVRPLGDAQIYEWQEVGEPREWPVYEPVGNQMKERKTMEQPLKWNLSVFVPQGEGMQRYDLNFIGLTKSQYDKDKAFLQSILDTLSFGSAGGASTAGATTPATTTPAGTSPLPTTTP